MRHFAKRRPLFSAAGFSFLLTLSLVFGGVAFAPLVRAQTSAVITNLAQLSHAMSRGRALVAGIRLDATVYACDTNSGTLVLQDPSGAEILELDGLKLGLKAGDLIEIENQPIYFSPGDVGVYVSAPPLLNNDGLHGSRTVSHEYSFEAGRYPLRLDWFNQFSVFDLGVSCVSLDTDQPSPAEASEKTAPFLQAVRAECFQGFWPRLPNFQLLQPVKTGNTTSFDVGFRTRNELVGIRFEGYFDVPRSGKYVLNLRSDDGSRLWIGNTEVPVRKIGTSAPPPASPAVMGELMNGPDEHRLVTIQGRVGFVSPFGKGLRFEMRAEQNTVSVAMADAGPLKPTDLLNAYVSASGVAEGVLAENQRVVLGRLAVASSRELTFIENAPGNAALPSVLKTVMQVHSLSTNDTALHLPVTIQGVVTAVGRPADRWMVIQDDTRGVFVKLTLVTNSVPNVGEVWSIAGRTQPGDFAPIIVAEQATLLGMGREPEPAHLAWNQLINGSMDVQWGEIQGVVTGVESNRLSLMLPEGHQEISMPEWGESELKAFDKAVVRIRGAFFAAWNASTHEVRTGNITIHNASVSVDKPAPDDPFDAAEKTPRGLFHFDARATPFQRVKVIGQVTYVGSQQVFLERGSGIQILPAGNVRPHIGDLVEAVGYPEISGVGPLLREALVRKTGYGVLPEAPLVSDSELGDEHFASRRIRVEGNLAGRRPEEDALVLQIQTRSHLFLARVANAASLDSLRLGSKLSLTGIYFSDGRNGAPSSDASHFELLVNRPGDVAVISEPSWWTLQRLLSMVAMLLATLALAAVWIALLKRQVALRTLQLQHEIRERERAERQHALETERSRIARDLHDDLGSSLTEINILASTGQRPRSADDTHPVLFKAIAEKARTLVAALDVIVWAVDPEDNSLQSLADYLAGYTREYLSNSSVVCRFKIPVTFPQATVDGQIRHEVLMVVKESLNNIVRHADATEVEFQMNIAGNILEICIADDGKGFDPDAEAAGHGLKNHLARLTNIGGSCHIESRTGVGTTVRIRLPMPFSAACRSEEGNTTFD